MTTWGNIKLITCQKIFATQGSTIPNDSTTRDYLAAMPGACNEALQLLATAGKFITKHLNIAHNPINNLLSGTDKIVAMERGVQIFESERARSYFFEYFGEGKYTISVDGVEVISEDISSKKGYSEVRGLIANPEDKKVTLAIYSNYPLAIKNIALYSADFPSADEVPTYAEKVRYNLREYVDDFYLLSNKDIYYEGGADVSRYVRTSDYFEEGNSVLVLDRDTPGNFRVYYKAYPQQITEDTPDDYVLSVDPEVATLIPLYIASQIYKDDDNALATTYRNEFEVAFERLKDSVSTPSSERFTSESGWV